MRVKSRKILSLVALFVWMGVIFYFSAKQATESAVQSKSLIKTMENILEAITGKNIEISNEKFFVVEILVRKGAHFFIYFILGMLSYNVTIRFCADKMGLFAECICILYAISDEVHQLFVPGRSGQISDVLLDSVGALLGVFTLAMICRLVLVRRRK